MGFGRKNQCMTAKCAEIEGRRLNRGWTFALRWFQNEIIETSSLMSRFATLVWIERIDQNLREFCVHKGDIYGLHGSRELSSILHKSHQVCYLPE
jgi:hypothetical protein